MDTNFSKRNFINTVVATTVSSLFPTELSILDCPLIMHELASVQYFGHNRGLAFCFRYGYDHEQSLTLAVHKTAMELHKFTPCQYANFDREQFRMLLKSAYQIAARKPEPRSLAKWSRSELDSGIGTLSMMDAISNSNRIAIRNRRGVGNILVTNPYQHEINKRLQCPTVTSNWKLLTHPDVPMNSYLMIYKGASVLDAGVILAKHRDDSYRAAVSQQSIDRFASLIKF